MYHCFRTTGYDGKAMRSVTILHQAAAGISVGEHQPQIKERAGEGGSRGERESDE